MTDNELQIIELNRTIRANEITRQINEEARIAGEASREESMKSQIDAAIETITDAVVTSDKVVIAIDDSIQSKVTPAIEETKASVSEEEQRAKTAESSISSQVSGLSAQVSTLNTRVNATRAVNEGGTGATDDKAAQYNLLNNMNTENVDLNDSDYFIKRSVSASSTNGSIVKTTLSKLWNYIDSKINSKIADYIVETGTYDNWRYIKYNSGITFVMSIEEFSTENINGYVRGRALELPFNVYNMQVSVTLNAMGNTSNVLNWIAKYTIHNPRNLDINVHCNSGNASDRDACVSCFVWGRWK